ncbi:MAG: MoaD/ThiS family protein [Deltaproteobacteria bacterium]|nr:MAG: MoaD/ThiS family protein [Deltaproteobacteria bacterium]
MKSITEVCLFGSLRKDLGDLHDLPLRMDIYAPTPLPQVLESLRIPFHKVQVVMVNHRAVAKDSTIHPGDRVSLFPREYPIFADWKDFRHQI